MNNLEKIWEERQKRKVKPYSRYAKPEYFKEMNSKAGKRLNNNELLSSKICELISPEMKLKLNKI